MRKPASQPFGPERPRRRAVAVISALTLSLAGMPGVGVRPAAAGAVETAQQMREAGRFAEQFFKDVRDARYDQAYRSMDRKVQAFGKFGVTGVLRAKRNFLIGSVVEERYTFATDENPPEGLSCIEARGGKRQGKLYLAARMIRRSSAEGWKVRWFKITSVPESGCPT